MFRTKRKASAGGWRNPDDEDDEAYKKLKADLAERDRIKAIRSRELEREAAIIGRTRDNDYSKPPNGLLAYFDVEIGKSTSGRMIFELFDDVVPRTVDVFLDSLRQVSSFDGDDFSASVELVDAVKPENFVLKHTNAGVMTINKRKAQILFEERPTLDGKQVVFGRLVEGFALLREVQKLFTSSATRMTSPHRARIVKAAQIAKDEDGSSLEDILNKHRKPLILPPAPETDDSRRNYRNKSKHYDNSTRSALFSWTTSA